MAAARQREESAERLERYMTLSGDQEAGPRAEPSAYPEKDEANGAPVQE